MDCKYFNTKNKYSILKYISSLLPKQHCYMAITLLTIRNKTLKYFYRNEVQYRDDVSTKKKVGM